MPPASQFYSNSYFAGRVTARPFNERALSMPRQLTFSYDSQVIVTPEPREASVSREYTHYTDFDYKVLSYMGQIAREDTAKSSVARSRYEKHVRDTKYPGDSYSSRYNYYDGGKHLDNYLYESTRDVLGNFKHFNLSAETLRIRNMRSKSPLVTRELDRFFERRPNYIGDTSAGCRDFRHYNYRRTPYFGGSDDYSYMRRRPGQFSRSV